MWYSYPPEENDARAGGDRGRTDADDGVAAAADVLAAKSPS